MKRALQCLMTLVLIISLLAGTVPVIAAEPPAEVWVCPDGNCGHPGVQYTTIQAGINAVASGGTVYVAAGTYIYSNAVEAGIYINKPVTLLGAQHGVDARARSGDPETESVITASGQATISVSASAKGTVIDGFTFQGNLWNGPIVARGPVTIVNNIFQGTGYADLVLYGGAPDQQTVVQYNVLSGNRSDGIYSEEPLVNALIDSNKFTGHSVGAIVLAGSGHQDIIVSNNEFVDDTPIKFMNVTNARIENNQFTRVSLNVGAIALRGGVSNVEISGNTFRNCVPSAIQIFSSSAGTNSNVTVKGNWLEGNAKGIEIIEGGYVGTLDAEENWWGSASGPGPVGPGAGDAVSANVDYDPWWGDSAGSFTVSEGSGGEIVVPAGLSKEQVQSIIDGAPSGAVILFAAGTHTGGLNLNRDGITIKGEPGATIGPGSPAFTVSADNVIIQGLVLDGGGSTTDPGIRVLAGADNLTIKDAEITGWADGVEIAGSVVSFKLVGNWIHNNGGAGLQVNENVTIGGITTIEGNLFKANGVGIRNQGSTANLKAQYNSWGKLAGPVENVDWIGSVDTSNYTFAELFIDVKPDDEAVARNVDETEALTVIVKVDAANLYGLQFTLTYDADKLRYDGYRNGAFKGSAAAVVGHTVVENVGTITYRCNRQAPDAAYSAAGGSVLEIDFTATGDGLTGNGPWTAYLDLASEAAVTRAVARPGAVVYVNNAGYGAPSVPERNITDKDDGQIIIRGIGQFIGFVDLQGRANDAGATVEVYDRALKADAILVANATSNAGGGYTTAYVSPYRLTVGTTYYIVIDAPRYLPTVVVAAPSYDDFKVLDTRPETLLNTAVLAGGDVNDDGTIEIADLTVIGGLFGSSVDPVTTAADINYDGEVDILDLVLAAGNYTLTSSDWTP